VLLSSVDYNCFPIRMQRRWGCKTTLLELTNSTAIKKWRLKLIASELPLTFTLFSNMTPCYCVIIGYSDGWGGGGAAHFESWLRRTVHLRSFVFRPSARPSLQIPVQYRDIGHDRFVIRHTS
jgi:hypothetical protein